MKNLKAIQDNYCINKYGHYYDNATYRGMVTDYDLNQITERYAQEAVSNALKEAAEKMKLTYIDNKTGESKVVPFVITKEFDVTPNINSILSLIPKTIDDIFKEE